MYIRNLFVFLLSLGLAAAVPAEDGGATWKPGNHQVFTRP
jgi:hypothetical protein